jgi:predicted peptidase
MNPVTHYPTHYPFHLVLPRDYGQTSTAYPLLLFLHGRGECGDNLELVKRHGPPKLADSTTKPAFLEPFIVLSPQCPADQDWSAKGLIVLLDEATQQLRIDPSRIYLTGISMGAYGAWRLALAQPQRFAALCPICGGGEPELVDRLQDIPIWIFHSAGDSIVPVSESDRMFTALQHCNADVIYTRYRALNHVETWEEAYAYPALYAWFLRHSHDPRALG